MVFGNLISVNVLRYVDDLQLPSGTIIAFFPLNFLSSLYASALATERKSRTKMRGRADKNSFPPRFLSRKGIINID